MRTLLLIIFCAMSVSAQESNFHTALTAGASSGLGYGPSIGCTVGGDLRSGRFVFSVDVDVSQIIKRIDNQPSESGRSLALRSTGRFYFSNKIGAQIGTIYRGYAIRSFNKRSTALMIGLVFPVDRAVIQTNYLHDVSESAFSANGQPDPFAHDSRQRTLEIKGQFFLRHRLYLTGRVAVTRFRSYCVPRCQSFTGALAEGGIGLRF